MVVTFIKRRTVPSKCNNKIFKNQIMAADKKMSVICKLNFDEEDLLDEEELNNNFNVDNDVDMMDPISLSDGTNSSNVKSSSPTSLNINSNSKKRSFSNRTNNTMFSPRKTLNFPNNKQTFSSPHLACPNPSQSRYSSSVSPPDKKISSLRLFDSPNTPKTLLEKSSLPSTLEAAAPHLPRTSIRHSASRNSIRSRLFTSSSCNSSSAASSVAGRCSGGISSQGINEPSETEEIRRNNMRANVNPFTPSNILRSSRKRTRRNRKHDTSKSSDSSTYSLLASSSTVKNNNTSSGSLPDDAMMMEVSTDEVTGCGEARVAAPSTGTTAGNAQPRLPQASQQSASSSSSKQRRRLVYSSDSDSDDYEEASSLCYNKRGGDAAASGGGRGVGEYEFDDAEDEYDDDYDDYDDDDLDSEHPSKRIAIHEVNVSRYNKEFVELSTIGKGVFGSVHLCRHRLDGCLYAVKRSLKPLSGSSAERMALNEVYAHAVLGAHPHVVRYYSAWAEDDHMIIQNEYCNGGSLAQEIVTYKNNNKTLPERRVKTIMLHLAKGLKFIHSLHIAHLDIKPENIFISREERFKQSSLPNEESPDDGFEEDRVQDSKITYTSFTYKIGDFGHVASVINPKVVEGDCRYMPRELLQDDYSALEKVDIFALGMTLYEAATGRSLPQNGPEWHAIRDGELQDIPDYSKEFCNLLRLMIHNDPKLRPSASTLLNHEVLRSAKVGGTSGGANSSSLVGKSEGELCRELEETKLKYELMQKELEQAHSVIKHMGSIGLSPPSSAMFTFGTAANSASPAASNVFTSTPPQSLLPSGMTPTAQLLASLNNTFSTATASSTSVAGSTPVQHQPPSNLLAVPNTLLLGACNNNTSSFSTADTFKFNLIANSPAKALSTVGSCSTSSSSNSTAPTNRCQQPSYPYNTRSHQQLSTVNSSSLRSSSNSSRFVGKKSARSISIV